MSRVGGGGYAEKRGGGVGDGTGGGMSGNGRDGRDGMGNDRRGGDSRARNSRYSQNTIATRPATVGNIATAITGGIPSPSMLGRAAVRGALTGSIDPYDGPVGKTTGFSYDGPNRFGNGAAFRPQMPTPMNPNKARAQALAPSNPMVAPDWWRMPF